MFDEMAMFIAVASILVAAVTVVGHGLWLLFATIFHFLHGGPEPRRELPTCPDCGFVLRHGQPACPVCHPETRGVDAGELRDLEAMERQLRRFRRREILDPVTDQALQQSLLARRAALLDKGASGLSGPHALPVAATATPTAAQAAQPESAILDALPVEEPQVVLAIAQAPNRERNALVSGTECPPPARAAATVAPLAPLPPRPPRRTVAELLAAFMEERNILWGELVGGLLIVGCSIALVISLWTTLREQVPFFPFTIFASLTAALFGAGLYTLHHGKLEATSRGLLVIATLLVPLNFLVMAGLSLHRPAEDTGQFLSQVSLETVALLLFAGLVALAAQVLAPRMRWLLTGTVVATAASQLLVPHVLGGAAGTDSAAFLILAAMPVACHGGMTAGVLFRLRRRGPEETLPRLDIADVHSLFVFLGLATFALTVALSFLVYISGGSRSALEQLAAFIAVAGVTLLAAGLVVHQGLAADRIATGVVRTTGTAVALAGMLVMLVAVALAWPRPLPVLLVCVLDVCVLVVVACVCRLPIAYAPAVPCLVLAYLTLAHLLAGHLTETPGGLGDMTLSARSGADLAGLVVLLAIGAEALHRADLAVHATALWLAAGTVAAFSLALTTLGAGAAALTCAWVYGICGATSLLANSRWHRPLLSYLGLAPLVGTTLWALQATSPANLPLWALFVAAEALAMSSVGVLLGQTESNQRHGPAWLVLPQPPTPFVFSIPAAAWRDVGAGAGLLALGLALGSPAFPQGTWHAPTAFLLAATTFLLAWAYQAVPLTWTGSILLLGGIVHLLVWDDFGLIVPRPWAGALLAHATLTLAGSLLIPATWLLAQRLYLPALRRSATIVSWLALPLLCWAVRGEMLPLALYLAWLAGLWVILAWVERQPLLLAAGEIVLTFAVLFGVTAWLEGQPWVRVSYPAGLAEPRSLQAYSAGLALLGLLWVAARITLCSKLRAQTFLGAELATAYRVTLGTIVVVGQLLLAIHVLAPGIIEELRPAAIEVAGVGAALPAEAGAWGLLGLLAVGLLAALWLPPTRSQTLPVLGLTLLALTVPVLAAAHFTRELAAASALRWGLASCFFLMSCLLWERRRAASIAAALGIFLPSGRGVPILVRGLLLLSGLLPVLLLTAVVAFVGFGGDRTTGPTAASFFTRIGWIGSNLVPLVVLGISLVGHGLREHSPGYAFAAGLLLNASLLGGYALAVVTGGGAIDTRQGVFLLQLATSAAAVWSLVWLTARPWLYTWHDETSATARPLMLVQLGLGLLGTAVVVGGALWSLCVLSAASVEPEIRAWITAAGGFPGWLALALGSAAVVLRCRQERVSMPAHLAGVLGLAVVGLLACMAERCLDGSGFRTVVLGCGIYALAWSSAGIQHTSLLAEHPTHESTSPAAWLLSPDLAKSAPAWVRLVGGLAVVLALKSAFLEQDHLTATMAVALAALAAAVVALRQRGEDWAFASSLAFGLAAGLLTWHAHQDLPFVAWWVRLVQSVVLAGATAALVWLGLRRRIYGDVRLTFEVASLLGLQVLVALAGNALLLGPPLLHLVAYPTEALPSSLVPVGTVWGGLALLLTTAAACRYARLIEPRLVLHAIGASALAGGVLAGCALNPWDGGTWLSYHVLLLAWTCTAAAILAVGAQMSHRREWLRGWVCGIGLLVLVLAARGTAEDPARPFWSAGAVLILALLAGALAVELRQSRFVYLSGMLLNIAGTIAWFAWGPLTAMSLGYTQVLSLALGALLWASVELALRVRLPDLDLRGREPPFVPLATLLALSLMGALVGTGMLSDLSDGGIMAAGGLAWVALAVTATACLLSLWDPHDRLAAVGLYVAGLLGIGLALHSAGLSPPRLGQGAALLLAVHVLLTAVLARVVGHRPGLQRSLDLGDRLSKHSEPWFLPAQSLIAAFVLPLTVWIVLHFDSILERLAGPLAAVLLAPSGVMLVGFARQRRWALGLRYGTLALAALIIAVTGWAILGMPALSPWLHRSVVLFLALALTTWLVGVVLPQLLRSLPDWAECARRIGPLFGVLASVLLLVVLGQETLLYQKDLRRTPMELWAILIVAAGLAGLIGSGIRFAVVPGRDPLGLSERGRMGYVYAVEALLVLLFVHARLTVPDLFGDFGARYWTFIVMGIAFLGVGLSELFHRRSLPVLAEPLQWTGIFLPLLPLFAFWLKPPAALLDFAQDYLPGAVPLLGYLEKLPQQFDNYALLWLLLGLLYTTLALTKRSFRFALLAALAANFGLWALLHHYDLAFLAHPQIWLLPLALIGLTAEHLNRVRLTPAQAGTLRYLSLSILYLSSTADMFIAGLGNSVVLPLVLAMLSVVGVLAGILLRVRAFLFLGVTFLCLVVFSMIWHAAVDRYQTWIWWASGFVLGVAILTLFAFFEKRRNDVLSVLEDLQRWR